MLKTLQIWGKMFLDFNIWALEFVVLELFFLKDSSLYFCQNTVTMLAGPSLAPKALIWTHFIEVY